MSVQAPWGYIAFFALVAVARFANAFTITLDFNQIDHTVRDAGSVTAVALAIYAFPVLVLFAFLNQVAVRISQACGRGDRAALEETLSSGLLFAFGVGLLIVVAGGLFRLAVGALGIEGAMGVPLGRTVLAYSAGAPFILTGYVAAAYLTASQRPATELAVSIVLLGTNFTLNASLPALGVAASSEAIAWTTTTSYALATALYLGILVRGGHLSRRRSGALRARELFESAIPLGVVQLTESAVSLLFVLLTARHALAAALAYHAVANLMGLCHTVSASLSTAAQTFSGFAFGRSGLGAVYSEMAGRIVLTALSALAIAVPIYVFRAPIAEWYLGGPGGSELFIGLVSILLALFVVDCVQLVLRAFLRAVDEPASVMKVVVAVQLLVVVPTGLALAGPLGFGVYGLTIGLGAGQVACLVLLGVRLARMRPAEDSTKARRRRRLRD